MEWIKMIELELGTAADWYGKTEAALRAGDVSAYGTAVGKAWGHTENALTLVRNATRKGFEPDSKAPNVVLSDRPSND